VTKGLTTGLNAGYLVGGKAWDELAIDGHGDNVFRSEASVRLTF
jgi:hypothetical protein